MWHKQSATTTKSKGIRLIIILHYLARVMHVLWKQPISWLKEI